MALAKLTKDSIASDNKPTESVMYQALVFKPMVITATTTEAISRRCGVRDCGLGRFMAILSARLWHAALSLGSPVLRLRHQTRSTQLHPGKLPLAHLHYICSRIELQTLVADYAGIDAHATTFNQARGVAT